MNCTLKPRSRNSNQKKHAAAAVTQNFRLLPVLLPVVSLTASLQSQVSVTSTSVRFHFLSLENQIEGDVSAERDACSQCEPIKVHVDQCCIDSQDVGNLPLHYEKYAHMYMYERTLSEVSSFHMCKITWTKLCNIILEHLVDMACQTYAHTTCNLQGYKQQTISCQKRNHRHSSQQSEAAGRPTILMSMSISIDSPSCGII